MSKITELTRRLNKIADDYCQRGKGKAALPAEAEMKNLPIVLGRKIDHKRKLIPLAMEMQRLEKAVKRIKSISHMKAVNKIANRFAAENF